MPTVTPYSNPYGKTIEAKSFPITRAMTAGTDRAFYLRRGDRILYYVLDGTASDAGTTATLSVGTTSGTPVEHVNALDVKTVATGSGAGVLRGVAGAVGTKLTADTLVFVKYAETGGASTVGSWVLTVVYVSAGQTGAGTE